MVTPVQVGFSVGGDPPVVIPMFGSYRIRFLPEPATFASLACGALALACLGARRYSSRASPRRSGGT
jgi:hypothetical protein